MTEKYKNTPTKNSSGKNSNDRADRLKNNLRANLQKRKSQNKARTIETNTETSKKTNMNYETDSKPEDVE